MWYMGKQITNLAEFNEQADEIMKSGGVYIFRGQGNAEWDVDSSATRRLKRYDKDVAIKPQDLFHYQRELLKRLKEQNFPEYRGIDDLDVIAIQQHIGCATMLMDFTKDMYYALYFACIGNINSDGIVVFFDVSQNNVIDIMNTKVKYAQKNNILDFNRTNQKLFLYRPGHIHERPKIQKSMFLFGQSEINGEMFTSVIISRNHKNDIIEELARKHNINHYTVFSDPDGFAKGNMYDRDISISNDLISKGLKTRMEKSETGFIERINKRFDKGDIREALGIAEDSLNYNPSSITLFYKMICILITLGDNEDEYDKAVIYYERAIRDIQSHHSYVSRDILSLITLSKVLLRLDDIYNTIIFIKKASKLDAFKMNTGIIKYLEGEILLRMGDKENNNIERYKVAIKCFDSCITVAESSRNYKDYPDYLDGAYAGRAEAHLYLGLITADITYFERALSDGSWTTNRGYNFYSENQNEYLQTARSLFIMSIVMDCYSRKITSINDDYYSQAVYIYDKRTKGYFRRETIRYYDWARKLIFKAEPLDDPKQDPNYKLKREGILLPKSKSHKN